MKPIIKVENLSKQYRLGSIGTGTLSNDLKRWWHGVRGKDDPFLKIGETNDRSTKAKSKYVWALKDINFEVMPGEILGIIGKNGAGKSTLLKILSRVTGPTTGRINFDGRIGSLLEVGTGFHPELTGRENIFLNGAILGMTKAEIKSKLDEIIDFSGCERYIDTPVKRYSSGMTVRLGFAVAAHLEPEILVVDEVLAVGDVEFQKKAIGKMQEVSRNEGRTILFVSHNMAAMENLCSKALLLFNGEIRKQDKVDKIIGEYYSLTKKENHLIDNLKDRAGNKNMYIVDCKLNGISYLDTPSVKSFEKLEIELIYKINNKIKVDSHRIDIGINNYLGERVTWMSTELVSSELRENSDSVRFIIDFLTLSPGEYDMNIFCTINSEVSDWLKNMISFTVEEKDYYGTGKIIPRNQGNLMLQYKIC